MAMNWPTFFTRLGSAVVFAAVMMCGLLWEDWMFVVLVGVIMVLCLREYFKLMALINGKAMNKVAVGVIQLLGLWFLFAAYNILAIHTVWFSNYPTDEKVFMNQTGISIAGDSFILLALILVLITVFSKGDKRKRNFQFLGSFLYILLPCVLLVIMRESGKYIPLILILCIWMNDTMAYIVGSFIGKTPFSKISPKKTWEGTIGGALLAVAGAAVAAHFIPHQSMPLYIALALCAAIAGTAGDLFESKLKRMAGVKDSGTMMPGHGGALDRFDSLLIATPFAFCAVCLVQAFT